MFTIKRRYRAALFGFAAILMALAASPVAAQGVLDSTIQAQREADQQAVQSQDRIDELASQTSNLLSEYRLVLREIESMRSYNEQLARVVQSQQVEKQSINKQLEGLDDTNQDVVPLMRKMVDMLARIVANDVPFLIDERRERVASLQGIMDRSDVTISEKYRRIMEAYTIEMGYGRDVRAYRAELPKSDRTVNFLQVGRTGLYYLTLDGEQAGWFNKKTQKFEPLDGYVTAISDALAIAEKQSPPNLVGLPVIAPATAEETP